MFIQVSSLTVNNQAWIIWIQGYWWNYSMHDITKQTITPSHKSPNISDKYPTMHHSVTEMCTCVHISVTKWCIVGYLSHASWDLWVQSITVCASRGWHVHVGIFQWRHMNVWQIASNLTVCSTVCSANNNKNSKERHQPLWWESTSRFSSIICFKSLSRLTTKKMTKLGITSPLWVESSGGYPHKGTSIWKVCAYHDVISGKCITPETHINARQLISYESKSRTAWTTRIHAHVWAEVMWLYGITWRDQII